MANGMASLMVGASGLKTSQTALNTTAHNLSNVNKQDTQDSRLHLQTVRMLMCSEQETAQASVDLVLMLML